MALGHRTGTRGDLVKFCPECLQDLAVELADPLDEIEGELGKAFSNVSTKVKLSYGIYELLLRPMMSGEIRIFRNPFPKQPGPLTADIIDDSGMSESLRSVADTMADRVVHVHLLFPLLEIDNSTRDEASMAGTGASPNASCL